MVQVSLALLTESFALVSSRAVRRWAVTEATSLILLDDSQGLLLAILSSFRREDRQRESSMEHDGRTHP